MPQAASARPLVSTSLAAQDVKRFERDDVLFPIRVVSVEEAATFLRKFDDLEKRDGGRLSAATRKKPHLLVPWLNDLIRHPAILGPTRALLGSDILCWSSIFFAKPAGDGSYVAWRQDATYWGLSEASVVTAWVAFTPSTPESGCMRVIPGSHHHEELPHAIRRDDRNMLSRSQEIAVEVDDAQATDVVLRPGEMSVHHVRLIHGSEPNRADHPRVGYAIRYVAGHVRQLTDIRDSATLVSGRVHGDFELEPTPRADFDADAVAWRARMMAQQARIQAAIG